MNVENTMVAIIAMPKMARNHQLNSVKLNTQSKKLITSAVLENRVNSMQPLNSFTFSPQLSQYGLFLTSVSTPQFWQVL